MNRNRSIELVRREVNPEVSEEMLAEAINLRNLARHLESGAVVSVAYAWVESSDHGLVSNSTYCIDAGLMTTIGAVSQLNLKLINRSLEQ